MAFIPDSVLTLNGSETLMSPGGLYRVLRLEWWAFRNLISRVNASLDLPAAGFPVSSAETCGCLIL